MNAAIHEFPAEEVMAFLDGELSPERAAALSAHLETCADCSAVAANFRAMSRQVATWRVELAPSGLELPATTQGLLTIPKRPFLVSNWVVASVSAVVAVLLIFAMAVPNLLRSKIAANESSAVGSLRTLNTAAITYLDAYGHYPPSLRSFGPPVSGKPSEQAADLVDSVLASGQRSGYLFTYHAYPPFGAAGSYTIQADPLNPSSSGVRHFSTDQTGVLYANGVALGGDVFSKEIDLSAATDKTGNKLQTQAPPMIARSAVLKLEVKKISEARTALDQILARHEAYIAQLSANDDGDSVRTVVASLRIPADQLNECIGELKKLGRVSEERITGEEVTSQHRDLVARLNNARTTESKLTDVIRQHTGKVSDILEVEKESARVRGEIEQMEAEQKTLEHRVEFATIDLKLAEEYKAQLNTPAPSVLMQLRNATINGFRNAFESFLALVLRLAESGPTLLLWIALLGIPAWRLWKRYRRAQSLQPLAGA